jgi:hypothetical protein
MKKRLVIVNDKMQKKYRWQKALGACLVAGGAILMAR